MKTEQAKNDQPSSTNGTGQNRWANAPGMASYQHAVQKVQAAILDGAGAEWVRIMMDRDAPKPLLVIEMIGGDEEKARGLIDSILPADVPYEFRLPGRRTRLLVATVRRAAKLNRRAQDVYKNTMLSAIRRIGGSFNPRT